MNRPILLSIAFLSLLSASFCAHSDAQRVYRWTDSQGVVHYSQFEPGNVKSHALDVHASDPPPQPVLTPCEIAKSNRDLLAKGKAGQLVMDKDGDGKPDTMSDDDIKAAKDLVEKQIVANCKD